MSHASSTAALIYRHGPPPILSAHHFFFFFDIEAAHWFVSFGLAKRWPRDPLSSATGPTTGVASGVGCLAVI